MLCVHVQWIVHRLVHSSKSASLCRDLETRLSVDVQLIATQMQAMLISSLTPLASAVVVTRLLFSAKLPAVAIGTIYLYACAGFLIQRYLAPDYATFAARISSKEGAFRRAHQRLIASAESIAMMGGETRELAVLDAQLGAISTEVRRQDWQKTRCVARTSTLACCLCRLKCATYVRQIHVVQPVVRGLFACINHKCSAHVVGEKLWLS
eukprot:SAG31_NODE_249_length_19118_cov_47.456195_17_plen_209_part_00